MPNPLDMSAATSPNQQTNMDVLSGVDPRSDPESSVYDGSLVHDSEQDAIAEWAKKNGYNLNSETIDYLYNQYFVEKNNATAWERTMEADSNKYQRATKDLIAAGINPIQVLGGYGGSSPNAQTGSVGSGSIASMKNVKASNQTETMTKLMQVIGLIGGALIYALL